MTTEIRTFDDRVADALARRPDAVWSRRGLTLVGWGTGHLLDPGTGADRFDRALRQLAAVEAPIGLATFTFDEDRPGSMLTVPRTLIRIDDDGTVTYLIGSPADLPSPRPMLPISKGRLSAPNIEVWRQTAIRAIDAIADSEVEKVVLSRVIAAKFAADIPTGTVLSTLLETEPDSHTYLVDGFVGSSPELLVSLTAGAVRSLSLAGSADSGEVGALATDKMHREHLLAADSVEEALTQHCVELRRSVSEVATFGAIQHLSTHFEGAVRPATTIADLLSSLHPTAAVAGTPTKSALELIRELESHDRGRYAGPVGWINRHGDGEFAIGLRCATISHRSAVLYTGAGLVAGSDPDLEYEETVIKLRPMLTALGLN
jgi:menaquinone-specific isochorismate synthase